MTVAVITLSLALLSAIGALAWSVHKGATWQREGQNASDLYFKQREFQHDLERDRDDLTLKVSVLEKQIAELKARLVATETQRNKALQEAQELVRREIRSAPDAIAALNKILAAAPRGVHAEGSSEARPADTESDSGDHGTGSLLATKLL